MTGVLIKRGNLETNSHTGRRPHKHEKGHLEAKNKALGRNQPSQTSSLHSCEQKCICCLSRPICGALPVAAPACTICLCSCYSPHCENVPSFHPQLSSHSTWKLNSYLVKLSWHNSPLFFCPNREFSPNYRF